MEEPKQTDNLISIYNFPFLISVQGLEILITTITWVCSVPKKKANPSIIQDMVFDGWTYNLHR